MLDEEGFVVRGGTARKRPSSGDVLSAPWSRDAAGPVSVPGMKGKKSGMVGRAVSCLAGCGSSLLLSREVVWWGWCPGRAGPDAGLDPSLPLFAVAAAGAQ